MKYLIIGAGGTGGVTAAKMAKSGKDVSLIARGEHLAEIRKNGLKINKHYSGETETVRLKAFGEEEYTDSPDVIFVCVKGYSVESVYPLIRRVSNKDTVVIPVLNIYTTGAVMQKQLPNLLVTDGCIYVSAERSAAGEITMHGEICNIFFGVREKEDFRSDLKEISDDLNDSGIGGGLSENIRRDALLKFSYVSPIGAAGLYFNCNAQAFQRQGKERDMFCALIGEIELLAKKRGVTFEQDIVKRNLDILSTLLPEATTSMQRDVAAGRKSEIDGLVYGVAELANEYDVSLPNYEKIASELKGRGI